MLTLMAIGAFIAVLVVLLIFVISRPLTPQKRSLVLIRAPFLRDDKPKSKRWAYDTETHVAKPAKIFHEYAVLAAICYKESELDPPVGWEKWSNFPNEEKKAQFERVGLHCEVWTKKRKTPIVAVVFRGTDFKSIVDWKANLRWALRMCPAHRDQYTAVESSLGCLFNEALAKWAKDENIAKFNLVTVGHSLGGGLAQCFAYTLPTTECAYNARVSEVYAFASSPVTAYFTVAKPELRDDNARYLRINHVFEHGEILAFLRLLLGTGRRKRSRYPHEWTFRFNLSKSADPLESHSMDMLAGLLDDFQNMPRTKVVKDEDRTQQLQLIYDYIKFHIGLYIATPPVLLILAQGLGVEDSLLFKAGMFDMVILYLFSGIHAGWFMGVHINRRWMSDFLEEFEQCAFSPVRRFLHHWFYWAGLIVGLTGLLLSLVSP